MNADERWDRKVFENLYRNKMFWKEVQRIRKGTSGNEERVKAEDSTVLIEKETFKER